MALTATMRLVEDISSKFTKMSSTGTAAFDKIGSAVAAATAPIEKYDAAAVEAGKATLEWTDKIGSYDKGAMKAIYTTEELIEQGFAVAVAVEDAADAANSAGQEIEEMGESASKAGDKMEEAGEQSEKFGNSSKKAIGDLDHLLATAGIAAVLKSIFDGLKECNDEAERLETTQAKLATIAGTSNLPMLTPQIIDLSNATGVAATELNDVAYNAISAGTAVEESVEMTKTATELAVAGFTSSGSALSVLSTAMNSYGDQIESVTDVADSLITVQNLGVTTVDQLAAQMGKAIATAAAYDVSLGNVESSYISITKAGINTAEATTYLSGMLNELGNSSSEIGKIIQEETGKSFGQLMNEGKSLADVLDVVYGTVNRNSEAMINLFGSQEAGKAAMAIINQGLDTFNDNLKAVENSAGATASAYAIMADTTEYAHNRMNNAALNTKAIIGEQLNGSLKGMYDIGAAIFEGVGKLLQKAPAVTAILTGATIGLAALTIGVTAHAAITKYATVIQTAFNAAMAANPMFWIIPIIVGVVAAIGILIANTKKATSVYEEQTAKTIELGNEVENLQAKYDNLAATLGEDATETQLVGKQLEDLRTQYESSAQTIEEFNNQHEALMSNFENGYKERQESIEQIETQAQSYVNLKNSVLDYVNAEKTGSSGAVELQSMMEILTEAIPNLSDLYDGTTKSIKDNAEAIGEYIDSYNRDQEITANRDAYKQALLESEKLAQQLTKDTEEKEAAERNYQKLLESDAYKQAELAGQAAAASGATRSSSLTASDILNYFRYQQVIKDVESAQNEVNAATERFNETQAAISKNNSELEQYNSNLLELATGLTANAENQYILSEATGATITQIDSLIKSYNECYAQARSTIEGQIGLFDEMTTKSELTAEQMKSNLESQVEYLTRYTENLQKAAELGFSDELIKSLSDGTEQSAGYLDELVSKAESLGGKGSEAAQSYVQGFNEEMAKVSEAKDKWATEVGMIQSDFDKKMGEIENTMNETVEGLELSTEAKNAASATISAYVAEIEAGVWKAQAAANKVRNAVSGSLGSGSPEISTSGVLKYAGHAAGSTNTEDAFIAGEQGPELYVGYGGGTVFPHSETDRIINAVRDYANFPEPSEQISALSVPQSSERRITIDLNGNGAISVPTSANREEIIGIMIDNLRPILVDMLVEEAAEEGEGTYEY